MTGDFEDGDIIFLLEGTYSDPQDCGVTIPSDDISELRIVGSGKESTTISCPGAIVTTSTGGTTILEDLTAKTDGLDGSAFFGNGGSTTILRNSKLINEMDECAPGGNGGIVNIYYGTLELDTVEVSGARSNCKSTTIYLLYLFFTFFLKRFSWRSCLGTRFNNHQQKFNLQRK